MIQFVMAGGILLVLNVLLSGKCAVPSSGTLGDLATIGTAGLASWYRSYPAILHIRWLIDPASHLESLVD